MKCSATEVINLNFQSSPKADVACLYTIAVSNKVVFSHFVLCLAWHHCPHLDLQATLLRSEPIRYVNTAAKTAAAALGSVLKSQLLNAHNGATPGWLQGFLTEEQVARGFEQPSCFGGWHK